jgi:hypothetical protein
MASTRIILVPFCLGQGIEKGGDLGSQGRRNDGLGQKPNAFSLALAKRLQSAIQRLYKRLPSLGFSQVGDLACAIGII